MMAKMDPKGIDRFGSFKSPDIDTPASKPVTAGKNIPNNTIKGIRLCDVVSTLWLMDGEYSCCPKITEISESAIAAMIKYCVLIAKEVLIIVILVTATNTIVPAIRIALTVTS